MNNNFNGYYNGQFPYGAPVYAAPSPSQKFYEDKRELRRHGLLAGVCVLAYIGLQYVLSLLLQLSQLYDEYLNNEVFRQSFDILYSLVAVLLPFLVAVLCLSKEKRERALNFGKPVSKSLMLTGAGAGFMFCIAGAYITSALATMLESVGITLTSSDTASPVTLQGQFLLFISVAVTPALIEEFSLRGVVLQPIRRYGDMFAAVMSSLVFAAMHGTAIQLPFAFIAGMAIAYFTIATNSMWTGVIIHFLNNALSVAVSIISVKNENIVNTTYGIIVSIVFVVGIACFVYFILNKYKVSLKDPEMNFPLGQRVVAFLANPAMILAFILLLWRTSQYIEFGNYGG